MDQVSSGNVTPQTAAILSAGRKDAQAALDAFKAGNDSLVKGTLKPTPTTLSERWAT